MKPNPLHRLPAPLESAVQRLKLAAREAAERTVESLGLAALAASNAYQRDGLLGAQFELNRKSAVFALTFNEAFDQRILRELLPRQASEGSETTPASLAAPAAPTDWASLSLVEDKEVEAQISADRFGMEIAHACEWELRELDAYVASLLGEAGGERDRNPLRPDLVGHAMIRGIEAVSEREDVRKVLSAELSRSLGNMLRGAYDEIVVGLRNAGVQPMSLAVRQRQARTAAGLAPEASDNGSDRGPSAFDALPQPQGFESRARGGRPSGAGFVPSARSGLGSGRGAAFMGQIDPGLMTLIRRLATSDGNSSHRGGYDDGRGESYADSSAAMALPPNVIRANRDELRQASAGAVDHMVIDVIGFMFDQILADPKVPPQLARQIARLQLPVLRAALGDRSFFSSRRHPVRRFINRIASLGAAFEDFADEGAKSFLAKVRALVLEVVEGDFDRIDIYEQKLAALEAYTTELAQGSDPAQREAASLLSEKEDQQRLAELYAQRLAGDLKGLDAPPFLREFIAGVWSQVLLRANEQGGPTGPLAQRLRGVGRELFLSVQPKATAAHRKAFLGELPKLMQDLTEGMNLIQWPEAQRRTFFGQLMPAHAEALKSAGGRTLDINLMARQVEGALARPPPSRADLAAAPMPAAGSAAPQLNAEEAQRVGLVQEAAVDWTGRVDIDLSAEAPARAEPVPALAGVPETSEAPEPTEGRALADHVQLGFAYQMYLDDQWRKVKLSHVSAARSFFIFAHGPKQRETVSLTQRMLVRLCETGRLKAFEASYLIERATARARRQLAAVGAG